MISSTGLFGQTVENLPKARRVSVEPFGRLTGQARHNTRRASMTDLPALDELPDRREPSEGSGSERRKPSEGLPGRPATIHGGQAWPTYRCWPNWLSPYEICVPTGRRLSASLARSLAGPG